MEQAKWRAMTWDGRIIFRSFKQNNQSQFFFYCNYTINEIHFLFIIL